MPLPLVIDDIDALSGFSTDAISLMFTKYKVKLACSGKEAEGWRIN
jgi:hypothetical protein